jgi:hypothetical protein
LETTILRSLPIDIANAQFQDFAKICSDKGIKIAIPEVALNELLYQRKLSLTEGIKKLENSVKSSSFKFSKPIIKYPMGEPEMIENLEKKIRQILAEYSLEIIKTPQLDIQVLLRMAVEKIPPFEIKKEKGFRDAAIMFTIMDFAKSFKDGGLHLIISNDKVFTNEEVLKRFEDEGLHVEVTDSIKNTLEDFGKLLSAEISKERKQRSENLRHFLEQQRQQISDWMMSTLSTNTYFLELVLKKDRDYLVESITWIEVKSFHSLTPGSLSRGGGEGAVKISFSAKIRITLNAKKPSRHQLAYPLYDTTTGVSTDASSSTDLDYSASLRFDEDETYEEHIERDLSFDGTSYLKKTKEREIYTSLEIERAYLIPAQEY